MDVEAANIIPKVGLGGKESFWACKLSGGQKRKLSVAIALVGSSAVCFLDEPTSGLDAFQALRAMQTLKALASDGRTVVASVHQPRGTIWSLFDDLVLVAEGRLPRGEGGLIDSLRLDEVARRRRLVRSAEVGSRFYPMRSIHHTQNAKFTPRSR